MDDKNFTMTVMTIFASLTAIVVAVNFWIDPLWHYAHTHLFNDVQVVTDEREQKTANQKYQPKTADTLLIGSSRSTYIHTTAFEDWDVYNYSVANLSMREYRTMIEYAFEKNPDYERIVLGVDFFKSSTQEAEAPKDITNHVARTEKSFYRTKNLLSLDVFETSLKNLRLSAANEISEDRLYNREGNAFARRLSPEETAADTATKIEMFEKSFYGSHYVYYPRYKEIMGIVKDTEPEIEKTVYTTPISTELFKSLVATDLYDDYEVWLRDLVDVYGGVWNFMYPNSVTNEITNYYDGHHFYPEIGNLIAKRVEQGADAAVPEDFGVFVTAENIEEHLEDVRALVDGLEIE